MPDSITDAQVEAALKVGGIQPAEHHWPADFRAQFRADVKAMLAAADAAAWQPIETAPREWWDGRQVQVYDPEWTIARQSAGFIEGKGWWTVGGYGINPTHLRPLPLPPEPADA